MNDPGLCSVIHITCLEVSFFNYHCYHLPGPQGYIVFSLRFCASVENKNPWKDFFSLSGRLYEIQGVTGREIKQRWHEK